MQPNPSPSLAIAYAIRRKNAKKLSSGGAVESLSDEGQVESLDTLSPEEEMPDAPDETLVLAGDNEEDPKMKLKMRINNILSRINMSKAAT